MEEKPQDDAEKMQDSEHVFGDQSKSLCDLFTKIQNARPAVHTKTIEFARKLQVLQKQGASPGSGASVSTSFDKNNQGNSNQNSQNQSQ